ncbi:hypothetical protein SAMN05421636_103430 [Pricia antarctica]|uniref:PAP2 superfamily protein n=1 Tax=Pricia antarctica TaxID=641691 RepID=A0A1G7AKE3_9FLAO|nr:hypothetical protein [Pricia antarctica]SDE15394.1 hypothetical protein SAMN05421636_103430 [Pricia antarctica]
MRIFFQAISYIFHPLFVPLAGTCAYFMVTPKYSPIGLPSANILPILILTVIIPIIAFFILRNIGLIKSVFIPAIEARKYPLYIHIILLLMVVYKVIPNDYTPELHFYFLGLIAAAMTALLLLFFKFKVSMHMMGMGNLFLFLVCLSIHFEINITLAVSLLTLATGLVATSRLYLKAHSRPEIVIGFLVGLLSQLLLIKFWL